MAGSPTTAPTSTLQPPTSPPFSFRTLFHCSWRERRERVKSGEFPAILCEADKIICFATWPFHRPRVWTKKSRRALKLSPLISATNPNSVGWFSRNGGGKGSSEIFYSYKELWSTKLLRCLIRFRTLKGFLSVLNWIYLPLKCIFYVMKFPCWRMQVLIGSE